MIPAVVTWPSSLCHNAFACRADKELEALRQELAERVEVLSRDVGEAEEVFQVWK